MEREKLFEEVQGMIMVDSSILDTAAYRITEDDWLKEISIDPDYCRDICLQWCHKSNVLKLKRSKYDPEIRDRCCKENHGYIDVSEMLRCKTRIYMQNLLQIF